MTVEEIKAQMATLLETGKKENRSLNADEMKQYEGFKTELATAEVTKRNADLAAVEDAQKTIKGKLGTVDVNTYLRSITKGSADVGNKEVVADVVRAYKQRSPLFEAHGNVQRRSTGNAYSFTKITATGPGKTKDEGDAGDADSTTAATMVSVAFVTYSGEKVTISQESLDDFAADISQEIMAVGMAKSTRKFNADAVDELVTGLGTKDGSGSNYTSTAATTGFTLSDLSKAYWAIPVENRYGVKFICNSGMAAKLTDLIGFEAGPRLAIIGLTKEALIVDDAVDADTVILCNPTLALAIAMKEPVRVFTVEVSEGRQYEVQPRFAVALRDSTSIQALVLKSGS